MALWKFIRNFSATQFYSSSNAILRGNAPFSFGTIYAVEDNLLANAFAFGNSNALGTNGYGVGLTAPAAAIAANGTTSQTVSVVTPGYKLIMVCATVPASGLQSFYVNGALVNQAAVGLVLNANPVVIGNNPAGSAPWPGWIAGCFYHTAVYTQDEISAMWEACVSAGDLVGAGNYIAGSVRPAYAWSAQQANPAVSANWSSYGSAAVPIVMTRIGTWAATGNIITGDAVWADIGSASGGPVTSVNGLTGVVVLNAASVGAVATGTLTTVPNGGTGTTSFTAHGVLVGEGASPVAAVAPGAAGTVLTSNGAGADPTFQATGNASTANPLSQFAATTSAQLRGVLSDETGTGAAVFAISPTLVTPALGAATATTLAMGGAINMGSNLISNLLNPVGAQDAATKAYADGLVGSPLLSVVISPASIGASQNDYNPTGWATAQVVRLSSSGAFDITGFAPSTVPKLLVSTNALGGPAITIKTNNAGSAAANRVYTPGGIDYAITGESSGNVCWIWYDAAASRWLVIAFTLDIYSLTLANAANVLALAALPKAGGTMTGPIHQTPTTVTLAGNAATVDATLNNQFTLSLPLTGNTALTFQNEVLGDAFTLVIRQDAVGGRKITGISLPGGSFTLRMDSTLGATFNTPAFLAANAVSTLTARFYSTLDVGPSSINWCSVSLITDATPSFA
jgi:hypothetical protein